MIPDFIDRKHGRKPVRYLLPEIEPLLKETYGVIVYQEQVMQIANLVAGYSLGEADLLRRAMGKKKPEEMAEQRAKFLGGARERGFPETETSKLFDLMEQFAGYGFNKSHSAAYGFLAYITAFLKTHHTVEFMAALLTAELRNADKVRLYLNECRDMGIRILPPDIDASFWDFTPAGDKEIRFGLGAIKNVGKAAVESVIEVRQQLDAGFGSLFDFCKAVDWSKINKRMAESAIKAGAMDGLGGHRAQMLAGLDSVIESSQRAQRDEELGQESLFGGPAVSDESDLVRLPDVEEWPASERLAHEKEMLGFYVTGHPLDSFEDAVEEVGTQTTTSLDKLDNGRSVSICGMLHSVQRRRNREGRPWASAVLEDRDGSVELLVFANQFEQVEERLVQDQPVLVTGAVRAEDEAGRRISVEDVTLLKDARVVQPDQASLTLILNGDSEISSVASRLRELVEGYPGQTNLSIRLERPRQYLVVFDIDARVNLNRKFRQQVAGLCGKDALELRG